MSRVRRDIEAMADLLLGPAGVSMPDQVSVLIDGNLPSRGDGWRSAAARLLAQRAPASFLQARFGSLDALHLGESQPQGTALAQLFESAPQGHHWIVSMGSALDPSTLQGVDEVVLLTGVDEAAIVAAYALLKQIVCDCPGPMPVVRLVLAGADSLEAGDRFVRTARARLGVEPIVAGCLPEPDRVHHAWQRLDLPDGGIGAVLTTLVAAAGSRTGAAHVSAHVPPPPVQASAPAPP
ncbi:MAG: hypothetical protein MK101_10025, partial [Phycisphaerales bacterium]|nr:hypothetical protein [Phycisphaerales bacterium]